VEGQDNMHPTLNEIGINAHANTHNPPQKIGFNFKFQICQCCGLETITWKKVDKKSHSKRVID